jgi:Protein of unknown function (DUF4238)
MAQSQKHHYVPESYLAQWHNPSNGNQLQVFDHFTPDGVKKSGASNSRFWNRDYNVLTSSKDDYYLPEKLTQVIDTDGIEVIRVIKSSFGIQLSSKQRSDLARYVVLQYLRTPKYREETDAMMDILIGEEFRKDTIKKGGISVSKEDVLSDPPQTLEEEKILNDIAKMSDEEFEAIKPSAQDIQEMKMVLNTEGHSKSMMKVIDLAKVIYHYQWTFLWADKSTSFVTSDNPSFSISTNPKVSSAGLGSDDAVTILPLSPLVLLHIDNRRKSFKEVHIPAPKSVAKSLNRLVVANSHKCVVARDKAHLESLLKGYKHKNRVAVRKDIGEHTLVTFA